MVRRIVRRRVVTAQIPISMFKKMELIRKRHRLNITNVQAFEELDRRLNVKPKRRRN